ncbi:MAG: sigma-70 family RNA polymerase sigma factor [Bacteroidota bacterium]
MSTTAHIDKLFRQSYPRLISLLLSRYGAYHLTDIENAVMDAYMSAIRTWPHKGMPDEPQAWLHTSAKNAYIDIQRKSARDQVRDNHYHITQEQTTVNEIDPEDVGDPELKLLFLICSPHLARIDQLAFMLKTLSGFGNREIAQALMQKEETIKKRLSRARSNLKSKQVQFDWPEEAELQSRLSMVHRALYLLFNEGFYSSHPEQWVKKDLCLEAMRLCKYLTDHRLANADSYALMSLMCFHISRYESRLDEDGNIILLSDQDRSHWDPFFINLGNHYITKSASSTTDKSKYQIEAYISAQHCIAPSIDKTNWSLLKELYKALYHIEPQDMVLLNLVLVKLHLAEIDEAKALFESIQVDRLQTNKSIYFMVGVELYSKVKDQFQIELLLEKAIQASDSKKELSILQSRLKDIQENKN